ncbi:hypothetical protein Back11_58030 [Paenibacillus baekrokdamisoli]|uniref:Uncharacterized protein n=1 Tax=Paenibacillus baekrokdamisoli TaxID=1712516 RepID=A0A3G9JK23_9BACL|nr:YxiJ family protein [Paenibacillus baekrokdamisoli]MBB3071511.1 hypothetical protein [Paenibacillus baekrokdamisoli]BBH24458.1 hypothetical protein Back11_58030 [Paenibacillus baekrokdamisoli]
MNTRTLSEITQLQFINFIPEGETLKKLIEEIVQIYKHETIGQFPYKDFRQLEHDFTEEFRKNAPHELITADFNTYMMFIYGLSSGGIVMKLEDPLERYKTKEWLYKSFFEWFPKYSFLEAYDFSKYKHLQMEWKVIEKLRQKLIELIKLKEIDMNI